MLGKQHWNAPIAEQQMQRVIICNRLLVCFRWTMAPRQDKNQCNNTKESKGDTDKFGQPDRIRKSRLFGILALLCMEWTSEIGVVNGGSEMKGVLIAMRGQVGIAFYQAPPEAHNSILCEGFHRHLNKVQKIGAADAESCKKWAMNALFAACAWNGLPVDGSDII
jgi:hypothetical protein